MKGAPGEASEAGALHAVPFVARWDLDKTYLRTEFDTLRDLVRTAMERPDQKRTVPGAASLLRELGAAGGAIHILSGSPRQMRGRIEAKLRLDGARFDTLTLKPNLENLLRFRLRAVRDQLGYKLPALLASRAALKDARLSDGSLVPEVLLGDDAEADAFVYSLYADVCLGVVDAVALAEILRRGRAYDDVAAETLRNARLIDQGAVVRRILIHLDRQTPPSRFSVYGSRVVPFYNYLQAALVLAEDGFLSAAGVVRVAVELAIDHRFDGEGLARSYVDLARRGRVRGDLVPAIREAIRVIERQAPLPAGREIHSMCDHLDTLLPAASRISVAVPRSSSTSAGNPADPPSGGTNGGEASGPDYLKLVGQHNERRR